MFNKQNFCHIASNNRNEVKVGVFVYKTTDGLETVLTSGYFNEKIVDINLHDLIIHEQTNATDKTIVERNLLCVVERTLENVGTQLIQSNWEKTTEQTIADIQEEIESLDEKFVQKTGDTMTGPLTIQPVSQATQALLALSNGGESLAWQFAPSSSARTLYLYPGTNNLDGYVFTDDNIFPAKNNQKALGDSQYRWLGIYTSNIVGAGSRIAVPAPAAPDTMALKSEVDLAANSGAQLTDKGVWYAKMYAATVAPAAEDGTNYADFSQTDGQGNPIIVLYERQNGAWVQTNTITPPAEYNGYVTVTSKIWDIVEQDGQQGGKVLWAHNTKTFTPYPQIISFEDAALTGNSTVQMPQTPTGNSIVNVDYLSTHGGGTGKNVGDIFFTTRTDNGLAGAVECNGATYSTTDFVGSGNIGGLLADGKVPYVSLATYQTLLNTQGSCGVFGWDGQGTTAFRVPSLEDIFIETGTAAQIGDYLAPAIPNIKAKWNDNLSYYGGHTCSGAVKSTGVRGAEANVSGATYPSEYELDASTVSGVYDDNATTVQPNAVRYRAMVQLATAATDEALETCTSVLADVAALKYDYVVDFQAPTSANNYTWYRKYKSGWVEQGGLTTDSESTTHNLVIPMADTNYMLVVMNKVVGNYYSRILSMTTTGFVADPSVGSSTKSGMWQVSGMAAN